MGRNFQDTLKKAEAGDIEAQYAIATAYLEGEGTAENNSQAINWFRKAAESGCAESACSLGSMYLYRAGLKRDPSEAAKWYDKALILDISDPGKIQADAEFVADAYYFGKDGVSTNYPEAFRWYRLAAEGGWANALYALGNMYAAGEGVQKDDVEAARWYQKAAEKDSFDAWYKLGLIYRDGIGVIKNSEIACGFLDQAARKGHTDAQYALGMMQVSGDAPDIDGADWLKAAALKGHDLARLARKDLAQHGSAICQLERAENLYSNQKYAEAVSWYRKAADQGHPFAQYLLGARYYFGEGVPRNKINAYVYWSLAGFTEDARAKLVVLEKEMTAKQLAAGQKRLIHLQKVIASKIAAKKAGK